MCSGVGVLTLGVLGWGRPNVSLLLARHFLSGRIDIGRPETSCTGGGSSGIGDTGSRSRAGGCSYGLYGGTGGLLLLSHSLGALNEEERYTEGGDLTLVPQNVGAVTSDAGALDTTACGITNGAFDSEGVGAGLAE